MAVNGTTLFVAWENQGTIVGNTVSTSNLSLGTQRTLGTGTGVAVAATCGWVASFLSGADVDMVTIDNTGTPGTPTKVNTASGITHPGIAAFGSSVAVVWADGSDSILVQRFNAQLTAVAGDQTNALEPASLGGNQSAPSIAAGTNFFVAAWVDGGSNHVRARFLDGTGNYLYNFVDGQNDDFQVSTLNGGRATTPSPWSAAPTWPTRGRSSPSRGKTTPGPPPPSKASGAAASPFPRSKRAED